jgi:hypothetical protein
MTILQDPCRFSEISEKTHRRAFATLLSQPIALKTNIPIYRGLFTSANANMRRPAAETNAARVPRRRRQSGCIRQARHIVSRDRCACGVRIDRTSNLVRHCLSRTRILIISISLLCKPRVIDLYWYRAMCSRVFAYRIWDSIRKDWISRTPGYINYQTCSRHLQKHDAPNVLPGGKNG